MNVQNIMTDVQMQRDICIYRWTYNCPRSLRLHLRHACISFAYLELTFIHLKELKCIKEPPDHTGNEPTQHICIEGSVLGTKIEMTNTCYVK